MQVDFSPAELAASRAQSPGDSTTLRGQARYTAFGEEPRTAGNYRIEGTRFWAESSAPSFKQALADTGSPAPAKTAGSFGDFLDMINPLQHIPILNMVYRELTGDTIGEAAQIVGGALFGGPLGAVAGTANAIVQHQTGKSLAGATVAALNGESLEANRPVDIALSSAPPAKRYNFNRPSA